jgi:hypothetical protein
VDVTAISTLLGSIKTATEIAKLIKDSDLTLEKAETKLKLADLISALADAKIEVVDVQQSLLERDAEIRKLKEALEVRDDLVYEAPNYWLHDDEGTKEGPFCQQCYDSGQRLVRLQGSGDGHWECKSCKNVFLEAGYRESLQRHNSDGCDPFDR